MPSPTPSAAVRIAYVLVKGLLVLTVAFCVVALASVGVGVLRGGDSLLYGDTLSVPVQVSTDGLGSPPPGLTVDTWVGAHVEVTDPTIKQMFLKSVIDLSPLLLAAGALWLLGGVLRSVLDGDSFGPGNVRRLRDLGVLLTVGGLVLQLLDYTLRQSLLTALPPFPS